MFKLFDTIRTNFAIKPSKQLFSIIFVIDDFTIRLPINIIRNDSA